MGIPRTFYRVFALVVALGSLAPAAAADLDLVFTYGSEKKKWIADDTEEFNRAGQETRSGKRIRVEAIPMGSGQAMDEVLTGSRKAHLVSPASGVFIELANGRWRERTGRDLVGPARNLVLSPVVIAMWRPMAEALGWGERPMGWAEVLNMADDPQGWARFDYPQWGQFKFGHTHPEHSNSGIISLLAETYAATGKTRGLTLEDVRSPDTRHYVQSIEKAVVHYGKSTGFFGRKMMANGPGYLSAAVLYENMVIESYGPEHGLDFPLVAVYPKEGTFWSDHPAAIVDREWVSAEHREAAQKYLDYLLARPQQERAMQYGFRPADVEIPLGAPFDAAHGVDPNEPRTTLKVPKAKVVRAVLDLWQERKKHADVVLVMDISGSMRGEKMRNAREGALRLLEVMGDADRFSLLAFNNRLNWLARGKGVGEGREQLERQIKGLFAAGGTALYDAVAAAHAYLRDAGDADMIAAVVVLTDGADTNSELELEGLLDRLPLSESNAIRVFPIGYGKGASQQVLSFIADATQTQAYSGDPQSIEKVFKDISTFF
jgi:Ca-activated chloride channel family protein